MTIVIVVVLAVLAVVLLGWVLLRSADYPGREVARLLREDKFDEAAGIALRHERLAEAADYYQRADKPARAAQVLARLGQHKRAAELYERGGDPVRAANQYDLAGIKDKAEELRLANPLPPPAAPAVSDARHAMPPPARRPGPVTPAAPTRSPASVPPPAPVAEPQTRAHQAEAEFRTARDRAPDTDVARAGVREMGREAAEALLGDGEIRRAADVYRDGGLDEEAIHLYVNVLGSPGEAAPLLAAAGNPERAAELYELAGEHAKAAAAWAIVARRTLQPQRLFDRIENLSDDVFVKLLEDLVGTSRATKETASLHYRLANALAGQGNTAKAIERLEALRRDIGLYEDVAERIETLSSAPQEPAPRLVVPAVLPYDGEVDLDIAAADLDSLAREVARSAAARVKGGDLMAQLAASEKVAKAAERISQALIGAAHASGAAGFERAPIVMDLLGDAAVRAARIGPSIDMLTRFIGGRPCSLQNIEVFFRLGLAYLAAGQWADALSSFEAVEEVSPGYRDAWQRIEQIRGWQLALGKRASLGTLAATSGGAPQGRYTVHGELGRGRRAVVYRATDRLLGRELALKFLSEELGASAEERERFLREARAIAQLNHPNIVTVFDFGVLEGRLFLAMEYIEGRAVQGAGDGADRPTVVEALRVARQVLDALAYAHGHDVLHGDVKPSNMLRTNAGIVKLTDFAFGHASEPADDTAGAGTLPYRAPEQLRGGKADPRADLFAVGVTLYEMFTGELPFRGRAREEPPPASMRPRALVPAIPEVLDEAVMRALELDPSRRFQTAADFVKPLRSVLDKVDRRVTMASFSAPALPRTPSAPPKQILPSTQYSGPPPAGVGEDDLGTSPPRATPKRR